MSPSKGNPIIRFRVDKEIYETLIELARKHNKTVSDLCRLGLRNVFYASFLSGTLDWSIDELKNKFGE